MDSDELFIALSYSLGWGAAVLAAPAAAKKTAVADDDFDNMFGDDEPAKPVAKKAAAAAASDDFDDMFGEEEAVAAPVAVAVKEHMYFIT